MNPDALWRRYGGLQISAHFLRGMAHLENLALSMQPACHAIERIR